MRSIRNCVARSAQYRHGVSLIPPSVNVSLAQSRSAHTPGIAVFLSWCCRINLVILHKDLTLMCVSTRHHLPLMPRELDPGSRLCSACIATHCSITPVSSCANPQCWSRSVLPVLVKPIYLEDDLGSEDMTQGFVLAWHRQVCLAPWQYIILYSV